MSAANATDRTVEEIPPQPLPDVDSAPFWAATASGVLALCRCGTCSAWMHPPLERCRYCGAATAFEELDGSGTIAARIVMHRSSVPGQGSAPHAIVLVDLDNAPGIRLTGRVTDPATNIDVEPSDVRVGQRVTATIVDIPGGRYRQPVFHLS
jgi:uncharacterized protein